MTTPDLQSRIRALLEHESTLLVEAGAGTGKTALLAGRVAMLLAGGKQPSQVAAITFTELAASELLGRITEYVDKLIAGEVPNELRAAVPQRLSADQREHLLAARKKLDELTCTTIHGFCQRLVTPYPVQANIDPGAAVMDEAAGELSFSLQFSDWLRKRLSTEGNDDPIAELLMSENDDKLVRDLAEALNSHRDARAPVPQLGQVDFDSLERAVRGFHEWYMKAGVEEPDATRFDESFRALAAHYSGGYSPATPFQTLWSYANPPHTEMSKDCLAFYAAPAKKAWQDAARKHGKSGSFANQLATECKSRIAAVCDAFTNLHGKLSELVMARLIAEVAEFRSEFEQFKRESALLDFDDLLLQARDLLRSNSPVRKALSEKYRYILVDEFQDTDPVQCEILFLLCGEDADGEWISRRLRPGQLFLVGDPKQSIYRFRRADIEIYRRVRDIIAEQFPDHILSVTANFRSVQQVLTHVNTVFAGPLTDLGFTKLECTVTKGIPSCAAVECIEIGEPKETKADTRRELEAREVAKICKGLIENLEIRDPESGELCRCRAGHIALLSPTSTGLWMYERALEQLDIPIATQAGKGLYRRQEVHDLIAIARVLSNGRDTMALGAFLRGPLLGLTEEQLLDIAWALPEGVRLTANTDPALINNEVVAESLRILGSLRRRAYNTAPFDLLSAAVDELQIRPLLAARHPAHPERALANVDLFLEMARPFSVAGIRGFAQEMMRRWREAEPEVEGRCDAAEEAVQIITVHSAKGLEWPVVIPVNMRTVQRSLPGILYSSQYGTLHCKTGNIKPPSYEKVKREEEYHRRQENIRLWYVAVTRARDLLLLPRHAADTRGNTWFDLVDHGLLALPAFVPQETVARAAEPEHANGQTPDVFAAEAKQVVEETHSLEWHQPSRREESTDPVQLELADEAMVTDIPRVRGSAVRGTTIHKMLEEVLNRQLSEDLDVLVRRAAELIAQLGSADHPDPANGPCSVEIANAVRLTLRLPAVAKWRADLIPEFDVYGALPEGANGWHCTAGICDAVAHKDGKGAVVFDWKSDVAPTMEVQSRHAAQLQDYLRLTGCPEGLIVYVTRQSVHEVRSDTESGLGGSMCYSPTIPPMRSVTPNSGYTER
jgi:exodeoxyribonuclease-5